MRLVVCCVFFAHFLLSNYTQAADGRGQFSVKGIGMLSCEAFVRAKDNKESAYFHFGGWIEGYLSASNKHLKKTFDIAPWQTTETIATITYTACKKNPEASFAGIVDEIAGRLSQSSLDKPSKVLKLTHGKYSVSIPAITYEVAKNKLETLNLVEDESTEEETRKAFIQYQIRKGLPQTGLPDQYTLWNLLESESFE
jgi:hypothetical protein